MSRAVNESKRARMGQVVQMLLAKSWTRSQLAKEMRVSSSTVTTWSRAKSMGTNLQRERLEALARMPAKAVQRTAKPAPATKKAISPTVEKKAAAIVRAAFRTLPKRIICPKCERNRTPDAFGMRVMKRDAKGLPLVVRRQSYCVDCRS